MYAANQYVKQGMHFLDSDLTTQPAISRCWESTKTVRLGELPAGFKSFKIFGQFLRSVEDEFEDEQVSFSFYC